VGNNRRTVSISYYMQTEIRLEHVQERVGLDQSVQRLSYGMGRKRLVSGQQKNVFLFHIQTSSEVHPAPCSRGITVLSRE
jgi:hypothetical protein